MCLPRLRIIFAVFAGACGIYFPELARQIIRVAEAAELYLEIIEGLE